MDVVYSRCCGLDVPKRTVVACLIVSEADGPPRKEIRTFETHTDDLLKLADWLSVEDVTHVAMEATGGLLEAGVESARREQFDPFAGQRGAHQGRPGAQDGCARQRVDCRPVAARITARKLRPGPPPTGIAGVDPLSDVLSAGAER
jgi:hypothetical protein